VDSNANCGLPGHEYAYLDATSFATFAIQAGNIDSNPASSTASDSYAYVSTAADRYAHGPTAATNRYAYPSTTTATDRHPSTSANIHASTLSIIIV
jgi:hypothetical protein